MTGKKETGGEAYGLADIKR